MQSDLSGKANHAFFGASCWKHSGVLALYGGVNLDHEHSGTEMRPELGEESNSISTKLGSGWYHSLCMSASRPRPPIKAYLSWGKSFYGLFGQRYDKDTGVY